MRAGVPRLRRAADGRRRRRLHARRSPTRAARSRSPSANAWSWCSSRPPTCSPGSPRSGVAGQTLVGFAAEHGERAIELRARQAHRQAPRRDRRQRHLAHRHRLRRRRQRGHDPHRRSGIATCRARARRRSPRRSSTPSRACAAAVKLRCDGERLRPLPARLRAARPRRPPGRDRAAQQGARPRARQGLDPRGARTRAVSRAALRKRRRRVRGGRLQHTHQRLRAVLPGPLDAAARTPPRGLQAARARVLAGARAGRLPAVPRTRAPGRRSVPDGEGNAAEPAMCAQPTAILGRQLSCRRAGAGSSTESGRPPAFFA